MRLVIFLVGIVSISPMYGEGSVWSNNVGTWRIVYNDGYWEGLFQMLHNNKMAALEIVSALKKENASIDIPCTWKKDVAQNIDLFFEQFFLKGIEHDPQMLSCLGLFESLGVTAHNAYLTDVSVQARKDVFAKIYAHLMGLKKYDLATLTSEQKKSYLVAMWELEHMVRGEHYLFHHYPVNQLFGVLFDLNFLLTQVHIIASCEDAQNYVSRLKEIPWQLQHVAEYLRYQKNNGIVPPAFALEKVMRSIKKMISVPVVEHVFYKRLAESGFADDTQLLDVQAVLQKKVYPAYMVIRDECEVLLHDAHDHGVWALPDGENYYEYALQQHTTTNMSPDEIHTLGLHEVQKIQNEMREILAAEGIVDESRHVAALLKEHTQDAGFYYPETEVGRAQCLIDFEAILQRCREKLHPLFDLKPKAPVSLHEVPEHEAEGAPAAYYFPPNCDGSRPGMFFVNTRNMSEMPQYRMETLAVHEAEPGHHFQISLQQEIDLPAFRKFLKPDFYNAYVEGWALYTEKLAYEQGFYSSNWSKLGHLQDELMRAVRLVVDTGIHKKRWTREQAIEYMERELGMHHDSVVTEIERYFVLPGQACSYKIGQLKFLELRKKMQDAIGEKFDIREFHNVVLTLGAAPLTVLEQVVDEYIREKLSN